VKGGHFELFVSGGDLFLRDLGVMPQLLLDPLGVTRDLDPELTLLLLIELELAADIHVRSDESILDHLPALHRARGIPRVLSRRSVASGPNPYPELSKETRSPEYANMKFRGVMYGILHELRDTRVRFPAAGAPIPNVMCACNLVTAERGVKNRKGVLPPL
jgi:hypothetical protein